MKLYTEVVLVHLPEGTKAALKEACARHRVKAADYLREGLVRLLEQDGLPVPELLNERRPRLPA